MEQQGTFNQKYDNQIELLINSLQINSNLDDVNLYNNEHLLNTSKKNWNLEIYLKGDIETLKQLLEKRENLCKALLNFKTVTVDFINNFDNCSYMVDNLSTYRERDNEIKQNFVSILSKLVNFIQKEFIDKKIFIESYNSDIYNEFVQSVPDLFLNYGKQIYDNIASMNQVIMDQVMIKRASTR